MAEGGRPPGLKPASRRVSLLKALSAKGLGDPITPKTRDQADTFVAALNTAFEQLGELAGRPPVLLVDGLDKKATLGAVDTALTDVELLEHLGAPIVLTGPAHLRADQRFAAGNRGAFRPAIVHNLPVVQHTKAGLRNEPAIAGLVALAERRRQAAGLPADVFDPDVLPRLALASSGFARDFLRLIDGAGQVCREREGTSVSLDDAGQAEVDLRIQMQGTVRDEDLRLLRRVRDEATLPADPRADELLWENLIACYRNDVLWYRPHELLIPSLSGRADPPGSRDDA